MLCIKFQHTTFCCCGSQKRSGPNPSSLIAHSQTARSYSSYLTGLYAPTLLVDLFSYFFFGPWKLTTW